MHILPFTFADELFFLHGKKSVTIVDCFMGSLYIKRMGCEHVAITRNVWVSNMRFDQTAYIIVPTNHFARNLFQNRIELLQS